MKHRQPKHDLSHRRFGKLLVLRLGECKNQKWYWWVRCDCGNETQMPAGQLLYANTQSCKKCINTAQYTTKHGYARQNDIAPEYRIWKGMRRRCNNAADTSFPNYGGRGIKVCEIWNDFANFLADMGLRPSKEHSLERIDNNSNYEPTNCKWATREEQDYNKRTNHYLTYNNETHCITEWARILGVHADLIYGRIRNGWSVEDALILPLGSKRSK